MTTKELQESVNALLANPNISVAEKTSQLLKLRSEAPKDFPLHYEWDVVILAALRELIPSIEEDDRDVDTIYVDAMLAEAYACTNRSFKATALAEEAARTTMTLSPTICGAYESVDKALGRLTEVLKGTGHPRLSMTLLSLRFLLAEQCGKPVDTLKDSARKLIILGELTGDRSLTETLREPVGSLLSPEELTKIIENPEESSLKVDPVEYTEYWEAIIDEVEEMTETALADVPRHMGFCHLYWQTKQEILEKEFGVKWLSPANMNPRVMFD